MLTAVNSGWLDDTAPLRARDAVARALARARAESGALITTLDKGVTPDGDWTGLFKTYIDEALKVEPS